MKPWMTNNEYRYGPGVENSFGLWECSLMRLLNFCGNFLFKVNYCLSKFKIKIALEQFILSPIFVCLI